MKLRGYRIELGEIEATLCQHPAVREAIALVIETTQSLIAYVVPAAAATPTSASLQDWLRQKLPPYMVPAALVCLPELPLTPNGKVDRRALSQLEPPRWPMAGRRPSPKSDPSDQAVTLTPTEEILAGIWSQLLAITQVNPQDSFFLLGGHSLLATQLLSRIREVFGVELPLRSLFEAPTLVAFAQQIDRAVTAGTIAAPPIRPVGNTDGPLPLSFAQQRLWFLHQLSPEAPTYNLPAAVRLQGQLDITALEQSLRQVIRRHAALRTTFSLIEGTPQQLIHPEPALEWSVMDCTALAEPETQIQPCLEQAARQPFDLERGPLLRVTLLRLKPTEHVAVFVVHHIIADGWSLGVLIQELTTLYARLTAGEAPTLAAAALPELPIQYSDFALWQRQWLQGEVLATKLAYWQQKLANLPTLKLPGQLPEESGDGLRPALGHPPTPHHSATHSFELPPQLSTQLQQLSRQTQVTLFMTLLAAFQTLLYRSTQQPDIVVGTDVANRDRLETEGLIGFFVNLLVLRTDLSGNPSFLDLLQRVRAVTLEAYAHQDLPFEKLVEVLRPERQLHHTPLFQVLFVLQNAPMVAWELPGLTLERLDLDPGLARFDLALFLTETTAGIKGTWRYNANRFVPDAMTRLCDHFVTLLEQIVAAPDQRLNALELLTASEQAQAKMAQQARKDARLQKLASIRPRTVSLAATELVTVAPLASHALPLVIQPAMAQVDLADWARNQRSWLETELLKYGAILFRGFEITSATALETLAGAISDRLFGDYGDLPREGVSGQVYGSTPYPNDQPILFHNESSHLHCWPQKIWFCCLQPARSGGETPIVDCRQVYQRLDPDVRSQLETRQLMYLRTYTPGLDVSWQDFFHTQDQAVVEAHCQQHGVECEWLADGSLRTRQIRPAVIQHPRTGETVFFNQIQLHHPACLQPTVRESLLSLFGEANLPRNVCYGDGALIPDAVVEAMLAVYRQVQVSFPWQQGDVLMLDNLLVAHSRNPFVGPRKIIVAMADMQQGQTPQSQPEVAHVY